MPRFAHKPAVPREPARNSLVFSTRACALRRQKAPQPAHAFDFAHLVGDALFELLVQFGEFLGLHCQLVSSLTEFVEQPRVLDGNDCLGGEALHQRNLLVGKGMHFLALDPEHTDELIFLEHRHDKKGPGTVQIDERSNRRIAVDVTLFSPLVGNTI
jgi:hypothetical protein